MVYRSCIGLVSFLFCFLLSTAGFSGSIFKDSNADKLYLPPPANYFGFYVDASVGYTYINWSDALIGVYNGFNPFQGTVNANARGALTYGFVGGYQINPILSVELGWYHLPTVRGASDVDASLPSVTTKSWLAYFAAKALWPICGRLNVFGKLGAGYRALRYSEQGSTFTRFGGQIDQYWSVIFGIGLQYKLNLNWSVSTQYLYFPEYSNSGHVNRQAPSAQLLIASIQYLFAL